MNRLTIATILAVLTAIALTLAWSWWAAFRLTRSFVRLALGTGPPRRFW